MSKDPPDVRSHPVVFLDIDGVLQPLGAQDRFRHDLEALQEKLAVEMDSRFRDLNRYDIAAVQYDWSPQAVSRLKNLCSRTDARIVVSSAWREDKPLELLKLLFKLHELDHLIVGETPDAGPRDIEVQEYLVAHPEIERFVILDDRWDMEFERRFPRHFVHTDDQLDDETLRTALKLLRRQPPRKKQQNVLDSFDALVRGDPALKRIRLTLQDIGLIRHKRGYSARDLLSTLCNAIAVCPKLEAVSIYESQYDFSWRDRDTVEPESALEAAATKNPAVKKIDIQKDDPSKPQAMRWFR